MRQTETKKYQTCALSSTQESCIDIPDCMTVEEIGTATLDDEGIGMLSELVQNGWPVTKAEVQEDLQPY